MFKSHCVKSKHRVQGKMKVDSYGLPIFAPDYSTTVLALTQMTILCILDFYESTKVRCLWNKFKNFHSIYLKSMTKSSIFAFQQKQWGHLM
jgi:hypothetical protein